MLNKTIIFLMVVVLIIIPTFVFAREVDYGKIEDSDHDGLTDLEEVKYGTSIENPDSDSDGYRDGDEVYHGYDPLIAGNARLPKRIDVDLKAQRLTYYYGEFGEQGSFLISSARKGYKTPVGTFQILRKRPAVTYKGIDTKGSYYYPNTKWNLEFMSSYYIHGAYWHNNFGYPMSHGCINVSYANMEGLYNFADVGTVVTIH